MGSNVYNCNHHHHHQAVVDSNNGGRSCDRRSRSALPMFCSRNSIKDVAVPIPDSACRSRTSFSGGSGDSDNEEPVSPKIGCMGQVKRSNRIGGFPASASSSYSSKFIASHPPPLPAVKYLKLKRGFSARNLTTSTSSSERPNLINRNNNVDTDRRHKSSSSSSSSSSSKVAVNIDEIDPPLPVRSKRFEKETTQSEISLWERRRSGRMGLKNLELQGIIPQQLPPSKFQPTTV